MNKAFLLHTEDRMPNWRVFDATNRVLGRLATEVAVALRGKDKVSFTPHADAGDYVVVINCEKVVLTGKKEEQKIYFSHSGWRSRGFKQRTVARVTEKHPTHIVELAVKGMLPKNWLGRQLFRKLKVVVGDHNPHTAQTGK
jgi:large subunit ribosomal protein L13